MDRTYKTDLVSDELFDLTDRFVKELLPDVALAALGLKDAREILDRIGDMYTPAIALLVNSAPIFLAQLKEAPGAAVRCRDIGTGPVAAQQYIAQWLHEHPEVVAQMISDPRWDKVSHQF